MPKKKKIANVSDESDQISDYNSDDYWFSSGEDDDYGDYDEEDQKFDDDNKQESHIVR